VHGLQLDLDRDPDLGEVGLRHCGDEDVMGLDQAGKMLENQMIEEQHW
jgi:hypothetical protein